VTSWDEIQRRVRQRAEARCEYCRMHEALQGATFHIEHIVPRSRGGVSSLENLAWACPGCNLRKSNRIEAHDPETGEIVPLFNPRLSRWREHFRWEGYWIVPMTPIGRATAMLLEFNHPRRIQIRQAEERFALFPLDEW
jgi:hypothetical protein